MPGARDDGTCGWAAGAVIAHDMQPLGYDLIITENKPKNRAVDSSNKIIKYQRLHNETQPHKKKKRRTGARDDGQ
jgi:hypothetical protein